MPPAAGGEKHAFLKDLKIKEFYAMKRWSSFWLVLGALAMLGAGKLMA